MKRRERRWGAVGYVILAGATAFALARSEDVAAQSRKVARDNAKTVVANQKQFCTTSRSRWVVQSKAIADQRNLGDIVTVHRIIPAGQVDPGTVERYRVTNEQLDGQREALHRENDHLIAVLGPEPKPC